MFLNSSTSVIPTLTGDYPEWHCGREYYSLWYIDIEHPELLAYLDQLRSEFSDFLYAPNSRQFHITLFVCGFLTQHKPVRDDDFSLVAMQQHLHTLIAQRPKKIKLKTGRINSFESALFVEVMDDSNLLEQIRHLFQETANEIAPLTYHPHLTLGLYSHSFKSDLIFKHIQNIEQQSFEFSVDQITFGWYQAQVLQGPLYPLQQFKLENA